jgi:hypothetical protein
MLILKVNIDYLKNAENNDDEEKYCPEALVGTGDLNSVWGYNTSACQAYY